MPFVALLDTCVLYPSNLRDTLLRLAEADLYAPRWSPDILNELDRNLGELGIEQAVAARLLRAMGTAFSEASVDG